MGVRLKGDVAASPASERTELLSELPTPTQGVDKHPYVTEQNIYDQARASYEELPIPKMPLGARKGSVGTTYTMESVDNFPQRGITNLPTASSYNALVQYNTSWLDISDRELTPKASRILLRHQESSQNDRSRTPTKDIGRLDADIAETNKKPKGGKHRLGFPSEELFSRLPALLRSSTSTLLSSPTTAKNLSKAPSDDRNLSQRYSQQSLRQMRIPTHKQSMSQIGNAGPALQRYDSSSSFYPSAAQSKEGSMVDFSARDAGYGSFRRKSIDQARASRMKGEEPPAIRNFTLPWNGVGGSSASGSLRRGSAAETVFEEEHVDPPAPVASQPASVRGRKVAKVQEVRPRGKSASRAFAGIRNFIKSGVTGAEYKSSSMVNLHAYEGLDARVSLDNPQMIRTGRHVSNPVQSTRGRPSAQLPESWRSTEEIDLVQAVTEQQVTPKRSVSIKEQRSTNLRHMASTETDSPGRFDHIGEPDRLDVRRPTLRKSFTHSMAKIKEKVSISGFKGNKGPHTDKMAMRSKAGTFEREDSDSEGEYQVAPRRRSHSQTVPSRYSYGEERRHPSTEKRKGLRRSNTARTMPSRTSSAAYSKKRDKRYDDCVQEPIFPICNTGRHDGLDGFGDDYPVNVHDGANLRRPRPNYLAEEYASEREFWRSQSAVELSIGTAR
jgi:hypothetical protein